MTGKIAGVQITSTVVCPVQVVVSVFAGGTSLNASNDPLIVIDGVPVDNGGIVAQVTLCHC